MAYFLQKIREIPIIELDDGKIYRNLLYLMVKTHGFPVKIFPSTNPLILSLKQIYSHIHPHSSIPIIPLVPLALFAASL
jgi:hypothetical protein